MNSFNLLYLAVQLKTTISLVDARAGFFSFRIIIVWNRLSDEMPLAFHLFTTNLLNRSDWKTMLSFSFYIFVIMFIISDGNFDCFIRILFYCAM